MRRSRRRTGCGASRSPSGERGIDSRHMQRPRQPGFARALRYSHAGRHAPQIAWSSRSSSCTVHLRAALERVAERRRQAVDGGRHRGRALWRALPDRHERRRVACPGPAAGLVLDPFGPQASTAAASGRCRGRRAPMRQRTGRDLREEIERGFVEPKASFRQGGRQQCPLVSSRSSLARCRQQHDAFAPSRPVRPAIRRQRRDRGGSIRVGVEHIFGSLPFAQTAGEPHQRFGAHGSSAMSRRQ